MPVTRRAFTPAVDALPSPARLQLRLAFTIVLTAANLWITVENAPSLYQVSAGHSLWKAGVTLLFVVLFKSLLHVWFTAFRRRSR